jgi:hypothetical protein
LTTLEQVQRGDAAALDFFHNHLPRCER